LAGEAVQGAILEQVSKGILEKLERGKKLSTEDILLYLDTTFREIRELGRELRGGIWRLDSRMDEAARRIDRLYELLAEWKRELAGREEDEPGG
jgi:hypothetical protein